MGNHTAPETPKTRVRLYVRVLHHSGTHVATLVGLHVVALTFLKFVEHAPLLVGLSA